MNHLARSSPNVKKPMPTGIKALNKNRTSVPGVKGAMVILKISTIAVICHKPVPYHG